MSFDFTIITPTFDDVELLYCLYKRVSAQPGGLARTSDEISLEYVQKNLMSGIKRGLAKIIKKDDAIIGSFILHKLDPEVFSHVLTDGTIMIDPVFQGKGYGSLLIKAVQEEVMLNRPEIMRIEIIARESNRALALYERLGFVREGRFERRIKRPDGLFEADIPLAWVNPLFDGKKT